MKFLFNLRIPILAIVLFSLSLTTACAPTVTPGTHQVSLAADGSQPDARSNQPSISSDGRYVAFTSEASNLVADDTNGVTDVFVRDMLTGTTTRVSLATDGTQGDKVSYWPYISANGRYTAFVSEATNLVLNDNNEVADVYVHDNKTGKTEVASVSSDGTLGNDLSFHESVGFRPKS